MLVVGEWLGGDAGRADMPCAVVEMAIRAKEGEGPEGRKDE